MNEKKRPVNGSTKVYRRASNGHHTIKESTRQAPNMSDTRLLGLREKSGKVVGIKDKRLVIQE